MKMSLGIHPEWLQWGKISEVTYGHKIPTKLKDKVFRTAIKPDKSIW